MAKAALEGVKAASVLTLIILEGGGAQFLWMWGSRDGLAEGNKAI